MLIESLEGQPWWYTPVIPAILEAKGRELWVGGQPRQSYWDPITKLILKIHQNGWGHGSSSRMLAKQVQSSEFNLQYWKKKSLKTDKNRHWGPVLELLGSKEMWPRVKKTQCHCQGLIFLSCPEAGEQHLKCSYI
jgi:hypothetical protein